MNSATIPTLIQKLSPRPDGNDVYIKRDDLIPFSFGGNKARKAALFFEDILSGQYDTVVTYGSSSSNHCRVVANMCAKYGFNCYIVSPEENYHPTINSKLVQNFGARIVKAPLNQISQTIDSLLKNLSKNSSPYFIPGGGHGNIGTSAYVQAFNEICEYESAREIEFEYIFLASGTGTTHAGLICGNFINNKNKKIVGISIARNKEYGAKIVAESVANFFSAEGIVAQPQPIIFDDSYICGGYGKYVPEIDVCINKIMQEEGIPLNRTYTGKAFWGMNEYLKANNITNKNILFLHTGGAPLYFDDLGV